MEHRLSGKNKGGRSGVDEREGEADRRRSVGTLFAVDGSSPRAGSKEGGRGKRRGRSRVDERLAGETLLAWGTAALAARPFERSALALFRSSTLLIISTDLRPKVRPQDRKIARSQHHTRLKKNPTDHHITLTVCTALRSYCTPASRSQDDTRMKSKPTSLSNGAQKRPTHSSRAPRLRKSSTY